MAKKIRTRGMIVGRQNPPIQLCPTCGRMRIHHPDARLYDCPVPREVTAALKAYALANGVRWKAKLRALWDSGQDEGPLRQARNLIGPTRIARIRLGLAGPAAVKGD